MDDEVIELFADLDDLEKRKHTVTITLDFDDGLMSLKLDSAENDETLDLLIAFASYQVYANSVAETIIEELEQEDTAEEKRAKFHVVTNETKH